MSAEQVKPKRTKAAPGEAPLASIDTNRRFRVSIVFTSPYMQHRMDDMKLKEWEQNRGKIHERPDMSISDYMKALYHCHLCPDTKTSKDNKVIHFHFVPTDQIKLCMVEAAKEHKAKTGGARKSMKQPFAGQVSVERCKTLPEERLAKLPRPLEAYKIWEIPVPPFDVIDIRSAQNVSVKKRVTVYRPKWLDLGITFDLVVKNNTLSESQLREILHTAGTTVGLGSYRPQHTGEFGTFLVTSFELIGEDKIEIPPSHDNHW